MAITTALSNAFKVALLQGQHDFINDTCRVALIKEGVTNTYNASTLAYSTLIANSDQPTGSGYTGTFDTETTGAEAVTATGFPKLAADGVTAIIDFDDAVFTSVTVQADGCMLYNPNADSAADVIAVFDFGGTVSATSGDFTIQFPAPGATTSILRLA